LDEKHALVGTAAGCGGPSGGFDGPQEGAVTLELEAHHATNEAGNKALRGCLLRSLRCPRRRGWRALHDVEGAGASAAGWKTIDLSLVVWGGPVFFDGRV
jgi:hypothetical protein